MQVGRHDHIQSGWLKHHARGNGIDEFFVDFHIREVLGHLVEDLIPQHHAMALGVGLSDHSQVLARTALGQLESKTVDTLNTGTGEHRDFSGHFFWQATVYASAVARVLTFRVFTHHDPVDLITIVQRAFNARKHAGRTYVCVLVKALANRQTQSPQRNVVRNVQRTHGTEENGIESLEFFQAAFRNVVAIFQVVIRIPVEVLEGNFKADFLGQRLEDFNPGSNNFNADTVTRNRSNFVSTHLGTPL